MTQLFEPAVSDSVFTLEPHQTGLSQSETQIIMHQMMSSLDLHKLASVFFSQLKNSLNADAVTIKFPTGLITLGDSQNANNIKMLDQVSQKNTFATMVYSFSNSLTLREANILNELHRLFKFPLRNALEHHTLKQMALKDHLTSLGNRVNYQETLTRMISQGKRTGDAFGLLVIDMDNFKQVNDRFGHNEGDQVLIASAEALKLSLRDTDYAFRFGGDEFCCLLPGSDDSTNGIIARRIQSLMADCAILSKHGISCSIGSTNYADGDTEQDLFNRADKALYSAKESGRSCYKAA
ncbi:GGDEF domain-containing protein [Aliiglaciecola sp. LCG003]|uniref:GGDEF domain-containing protein n=1 Tax=Aliiglaciecola sp. LCG003 TaxID=3053655 RepID=UPI002572CAA8|nr:GGDEF domain-containing protein [Aliiglaciecola sp. LCG003]WJG11319.1 GGDEF domain-containing protein [Aliiglaciecola sp. LCG003]